MSKTTALLTPRGLTSGSTTALLTPRGLAGAEAGAVFICLHGTLAELPSLGGGLVEVRSLRGEVRDSC